MNKGWRPATQPRPANRRLCGLDFNELLARLGGDGIARVAAVLDVKLDGFTDVVQGFGAGVALADASRQSRHAGDIPAVFFLFQNDCITHWMILLAELCDLCRRCCMHKEIEGTDHFADLAAQFGL
jgi:hypothetical protein